MTADSVTCKICIKTVNEFYDLLEAGSGRELILPVLEKMCGLFAEEDQKKCKKFVDKEYDKLIDFLKVGYSPDKLCTLMTLCDHPMPVIDGVCDICMIGFTFLEDFWTFKPTEEAIESILEFLCNIFPEGENRELCQEFIDREFEKLVDWIDQEFPPKFICTAAGACDFPIDPIEDGLCLFCEGAFTFIYDVFDFDEEKGKGFIEGILAVVCQIFPAGDSRDICQQFIDQEYEKLLDFIEHEFSPETICILTGACESNITPEFETECEFCYIFYQFALDLLDFDVTIEAIEHLLEHICNIFPENLVLVCDIFIDHYFEKLIEALLAKYPASVACELMGACTL